MDGGPRLSRGVSGGLSGSSRDSLTRHDQETSANLVGPQFGGELIAQVLGLGDGQSAALTVLLDPREGRGQRTVGIAAHLGSDLPQERTPELELYADRPRAAIPSAG